MFRSNNASKDRPENVVSEAGILTFFWIATRLWKSSPADDGREILKRAGARANFLFQKPVDLDHLHRFNLAEEDTAALESLKTDESLRSLVMQSQRVMELTAGTEKPDPRLMERFGTQYPIVSDTKELRASIDQMQKVIAPQLRQMQDAFAAAGYRPPNQRKTVKRVTPLRRDLEKARQLAWLMFLKEMRPRKITSQKEWELVVFKSDARAYLMFGEPVPRGCARLMDLAVEEKAAMEAIRLDSLLKELVVQSQRVIAVVQFAETGDSSWGMDSQVLGDFGADIPDAPVKFRNLLRRVEKRLRPFKKELQGIEGRFTHADR